MDALLTGSMAPGSAISVDTSHLAVLETCLAHDIHMLNDIGGLVDPALAARAGEAGLAACGMASFSTPGDSCGVDATLEALALVVTRAAAAGIEPLILDPGVGLWTAARTVEHDWALCCAFDRFTAFGYPVLAAVSRKTFLGELTGRPSDGRPRPRLPSRRRCSRKGRTSCARTMSPRPRTCSGCVSDWGPAHDHRLRGLCTPARRSLSPETTWRVRSSTRSPGPMREPSGRGTWSSSPRPPLRRLRGA